MGSNTIQLTKRLTAAILFALCLLLVPSSASAAELLTNGGFETGDLSGWSATNATIATTPTLSGSYSARLNTGGQLSQTFTVVPNQAYSYYLAVSPQDGLTRISLIDGSQTLASVNWADTAICVPFCDSATTVTPQTSTLTLLIVQESGNESYVDAASITGAAPATPEPTTAPPAGATLPPIEPTPTVLAINPNQLPQGTPQSVTIDGVPPLPTPIDTSQYTTDVEIELGFTVDDMAYFMSVIDTPIQLMMSQPALQLLMFAIMILISIRVVKNFVGSGSSSSDPPPPRHINDRRN